MASDPTDVRPDGDQLAREQNTDALKWAQALADVLFSSKAHRWDKDTFEDTMVGWFANAIEAMRGSLQTQRREHLASSTQGEVFTEAEEEWTRAREEQALIDGDALIEHRPVEQAAEPVISDEDWIRHRRYMLGQWWRQRAEAEIEMVVAKAIEYGAGDLAEIGRQLVQAGVQVPSEPRWEPVQPYHAELGVYFYLLGKVARWTSAIQEGRPVSDDTLLDIGVYVRMAQRIREVGGWPGV